MFWNRKKPDTVSAPPSDTWWSDDEWLEHGQGVVEFPASRAQYAGKSEKLKTERFATLLSRYLAAKPDLEVRAMTEHTGYGGGALRFIVVFGKKSTSG